MKLTATIRVSWWVWPYIHALRAFAFITGMEPDVEKAMAVVSRGLRVTVP